MSETDITADISFAAISCPICGLELDSKMPVCPNDGTTVLPDVGQIFEDKYEFIERRAAGGMGTVFKANQRALNRVVAIKVLHTRDPSATTVRRFQQEAKALATLEHTNLVHMLELGVTAYGQLYSVMEYVDGIGLDELLKERGRPSLKKALNIMYQVCDALAYVHGFGIYHRDLKPSNIMLIDPYDENPKVKLVDFGIAKILDTERTATLTETGEFCGSPLYMSPEQAKGSKIDQRTDLYSLGCVLYEMLTGAPPFAGGTIVQIIFQQVGEKPKSLNSVDPSQKYPNALENIVRKLLEKDPEDRFQSAADVRDQIKALSSQKKGWYHIALPGVDTGSSISSLGWCAMAAAALAFVSLACYLIYGSLSDKPVSAKISNAIELQALPFDQVEDAASQLDEMKSGGSAALKPAKKDVSLFCILTQKDHLTMMGGSRECFLHMKDRNDWYITEISAYKIDDEGVAAMPDFPLHVIDFKHAPITSPSIKRITHYQNVSVLDLTDVKLNAEDCRELPKLHKLTDLRLNGCRLDDQSVKYLSQAKKLTQLHLAGNPDISNLAVSYLVAAQLPLFDLDLSATRVSDEGSAELAKMPELETLNLSRNKLTDKSLLSLAQSKSLRSLDLSKTSITDNGLSTVKTNGLLRLVLEGCGYSKSAVRKFKEHNPRCEVFPDDENKINKKDS